MPASSSTSTFTTMRTRREQTSDVKIAAPMAIGTASTSAISDTIADPYTIGSAPNSCCRKYQRDVSKNASPSLRRTGRLPETRNTIAAAIEANATMVIASDQTRTRSRRLFLRGNGRPFRAKVSQSQVAMLLHELLPACREHEVDQLLGIAFRRSVGDEEEWTRHRIAAGGDVRGVRRHERSVVELHR